MLLLACITAQRPAGRGGARRLRRRAAAVHPAAAVRVGGARARRERVARAATLPAHAAPRTARAGSPRQPACCSCAAVLETVGGAAPMSTQDLQETLQGLLRVYGIVRLLLQHSSTVKDRLKGYGHGCSIRGPEAKRPSGTRRGPMGLVSRPGERKLTFERIGQVLGEWQPHELRIARGFAECRGLSAEQLEDIYQETAVSLLRRPYLNEEHLRNSLREGLKYRALNLHRDERRRGEILTQNAPGLHRRAEAREEQNTPELAALAAQDRLIVSGVPDRADPARAARLLADRGGDALPRHRPAARHPYPRGAESLALL